MFSHDIPDTALCQNNLMTCEAQTDTPHSRSEGTAESEGCCRSSYREHRSAPPWLIEHGWKHLMSSYQTPLVYEVVQGRAGSHSSSMVDG